jgi:hypothetical protein
MGRGIAQEGAQEPALYLPLGHSPLLQITPVVIPGLVPVSSLITGACGSMDPGDKHRDDIEPAVFTSPRIMSLDAAG